MSVPYTVPARGPDGTDYLIEALPRGMADCPRPGGLRLRMAEVEYTIGAADLLRHWLRYRGAWAVRVRALTEDAGPHEPLGELYASTGARAIEVVDLLRTVIAKRGYPRAPVT